MTEDEWLTEAEWLACTDPTTMLGFLRGKASDRKLRLFACACCRRLWHLLPDERWRNAVEIVERYADGLASESDLTGARQVAGEVGSEASESTQLWLESLELIPEDLPEAKEKQRSDQFCEERDRRFRVEGWLGAAWNATSTDAHSAAIRTAAWMIDDEERTRATQVRLLCCIVGPLPFRPLTVEPCCLSPTVVALARTVYDTRAFDRLPILADVLEEAGCHDGDILLHCRGPGPHVRGCWVIDLLLRKE